MKDPSQSWLGRAERMNGQAKCRLGGRPGLRLKTRPSARGEDESCGLCPLCQNFRDCSERDSFVRHGDRLSLDRREKRPVILERQVSIKPKRTSARKRAFTSLIVALVGLTACALFLDVYLLRELLLFVALAAPLVFFAANLALLGVLFHAAGRSVLHAVRSAKTRNAQQQDAHAEQHLGPFVVSPSISTVARTGRL